MTKTWIRQHGRTLSACAGLLLAVLLVYQPAWHGGFIWDDDTHLLENPVLKPGGVLLTWVPGTYINYWPLTFTVYWLEYQLWGLAPLGYHLVNIGLHALSAILVWRIFGLLRVPGAMFAAALFALHPVNVESVAWIAQLKNTLSLALTLVSVVLYLLAEKRGQTPFVQSTLRAVPANGACPILSGAWWLLVSSIVVFALAALAKGMTLTLPAVLLACAWWQRGRIQRQDLLRVAPFLLIAAAMVLMEVLQQHAVAQQTVVRSDGPLSRTAVAGCAVWFYFWKLIWPVDLIFVYPRWDLTAVGVRWFVPGLLLAAILALAWWQRRGWGRPVVMLIVCYVALLLPVLGFVNIYFMEYSLVADHWQYAATIVPCAVFAGSAAAVWSRRGWGRRSGALLGLALLATLAALTWCQSRMYTDVKRLYQTTIERNPGCWLAYHNLGICLAKDHHFDKAVKVLRKGLEVKSDQFEAYNSLGSALIGRGSRGDFEEALAQYRRALAIHPGYLAAQLNLAQAIALRRPFEEAVGEYRKAVAIAPGDATAHYEFAVALADHGRREEAIEQFQAALEAKPKFAAAHGKLGSVLKAEGQFDDAIAHYRASLAIDPTASDVGNNLAWLLATCPQPRLRNGSEAIEVARRAVQGADEPATVLDTLAAAYAEAGRFPEAVATAQQALQLATAKKITDLEKVLRGRLALYRAGKPFHQTNN